MQMTTEEMLIVFVMQLLDLYEFDINVEDWIDNEDTWELYKWKRVLTLTDMQCWNLGNIEWDQFLNLAEVIERMDVYHNDYIWESLADAWLYFNNYDEVMKLEDKEYDWDIFAAQFIMSPYIWKMLKKITPRKVEDMKLKLQKDWEKYWVDFDYKLLRKYL